MHRFDVKTINNVELRRKTFKTTLNYKLQWLASMWWQNDHNNAKLRKLSNYDELHRFDDKTIKYVELRRKTLRTTQNYKWSINNDLHRFHVKTNKNVELRRKPFKTTQYYKTDQSTMNCIDWMSKRSIMLSYVAKHSKQR